MIASIRKNFSNLDSISAVGMFVSIACAIHCMALPLIILIAPLTGIAFFENETLEHLTLATSILITGFSLFSGFKTHKNIQLMALFCLAILILISSHWLLPITFKPWGDGIGALLIATSLFWNLKLTHTHDEHCEH